MAATYTKFSIEDIDKFLKRGFRALRPRQFVDVFKGRREYAYDLKLADNVFIRVLTSVPEGRDLVRSKEARPMRIALMAGVPTRKGQPLTGKAKFPIIKRTQGWRSTLQRRIQEFIELYYDNEDKFTWIGGKKQEEQDATDGKKPQEPSRREPPAVEAAPDPADPEEADEPQRPRFTGPPITGPQVGFVMKLIANLIRQGKLRDVASGYGFDSGDITEEDVKRTLSKASASKFINAAKEALGWGQSGGGGRRRRYADEGVDFEGEVEEKMVPSSYSYDRT